MLLHRCGGLAGDPRYSLPLLTSALGQALVLTSATGGWVGLGSADPSWRPAANGCPFTDFNQTSVPLLCCASG